MAVTATPAFVQVLRATQAVVTGATTDRSSPGGNLVSLWTAGSNGSNITRLYAVPRATVTATELQLYLSTDGGSTKVYLDSVLMAAHTVANTTAVPTTAFTKYSEASPLYLPASAILYAAAAVALAGGIVFCANGGDL
ncbi:MAG: hypothetical protein RIB84_00610 [Sneathiellaceae bacterium]